jgi:hypothetical protein
MSTSPFHHRPGSQTEDESDEDASPFNTPYGPATSTDRIPLTQGVETRSPLPPYTTSPPLPDRGQLSAGSRYTLTESYIPSARSSTANFGFGPAPVRFPDATGGRPMSALSNLTNLTEDWIQRQQVPSASQADLRRYPTRRVKLNEGNVFSADYP